MSILQVMDGGVMRDATMEEIALIQGLAAEPLPPEVRYITVFAFRNRFTKSEKVRIEIAALDDPGASHEQRARAATIRVGQADLAAATYVDVDRADTRSDLLEFEAMGLLDAPGRALAILDDPIQTHERFNV